MGTNYYVKPAPDCPTCGRPHVGAHIGKKSHGWRFLWAPLPEDAIAFTTTRRAWMEYLKDKEIINEYDEAIDPVEFYGMAYNPNGMVLDVENIGSAFANPKDYERIGPDGERISLRGGFS